MIDLHVDGRPAAVSRAADLMGRTVPDALGTAGADAAQGARGGVGWSGRSGTAYAATAADLGAGGKQVAAASRLVGDRLRELATELQELKSAMADLAQRARDADLDVNGEAIEDPGAPVPAPRALSADPTPDEREQHDRLATAHDEQLARIEAYRRLSDDRDRLFEEHEAWVHRRLGSLPGLVEEAVEELPRVLLEVAKEAQTSALGRYAAGLRERAHDLEVDQVRRALERSEETRSQREAREDERQRRTADADRRAADLTDDFTRRFGKALDLADKGFPLVDLLAGTPPGKVAAEELLSWLATRAGLAALGLTGGPALVAGLGLGIAGGLAADAVWDALPPEVRDKIDPSTLLGRDDPEPGRDPSPPTSSPGPTGPSGPTVDDGFAVPYPDHDPGIGSPRPDGGDREFSHPFTLDGDPQPVSA
ncbi:hypothetical protein [Nocardioides sp.]|uniref:hypothetical protein n=1 Tax=Nocardioides sp. TaxID=35761 RepID=UPI00271A4918|nr:hypothetical protein [Nocardioides sp.]MDO9455155.1 hypothetical protein [Nocardioides sp.]